jgi:hypothetical protein
VIGTKSTDVSIILLALFKAHIKKGFRNILNPCFIWWADADSNCGPPACKAIGKRALTAGYSSFFQSLKKVTYFAIVPQSTLK